MVHLQDALTAGGHFARCASLLLSELALGALVAKHLDLAVRAVDNVVLSVGGALDVGVNLEVEGQALDALLQRKVRGEALDSQRDEGGLLQYLIWHM